MRMMYKLIGRELKDAGMTSAHPTHYLNFYCLGNREEGQAASQVPQGTDPVLHSLLHRFNSMIS